MQEIKDIQALLSTFKLQYNSRLDALSGAHTMTPEELRDAVYALKEFQDTTMQLAHNQLETVISIIKEE